ncbi:MAG: ribonuclease HII [Clostridiales bacterium]|nr:ribonuclease HII [Clostridiales bacterium]
MKSRTEAEENERLDALRKFEADLQSRGYALIAGIDEVGRGPLAGPVMAAAVILPAGARIPGINDSKKLSAKKREMLAKAIKEHAVAWAIGAMNEKAVDEMNILQATRKAMEEAVEGLSQKPDALLIDALSLPKIPIKQLSIVKGDSLSVSIAAASILAKVERDALMTAYHELYPEYGFDSNKGYGTAKHLEAIGKYGLCPIHRVTFAAKFL